MAEELNADWLSRLPSSWSYGVTRDGRVFFINEEAKSTNWLHPVTGEAVITGHRKTPDLPTGWEEGYTFEGARCFIKTVLMIKLFILRLTHRGFVFGDKQENGFIQKYNSFIVYSPFCCSFHQWNT
ncbi:pleckstrin homology domain-containing family A member 5-like isoform X21 [Myxocyprinus asiaticus]|uniref:pleckstrin homology domain-containing family A member 5-like isoform X21 n=1 Tax=Myxocyprinus asiaticus TaxID=70543 RepID=UPI002223586D|nr:pleckstrin homology domain-containing family A member 5-like isoform X21 [Myxocyprinus asiaticus]